MSDDATLLRRYAEDRSEAAFAELVRRHLNLVYAVALRQCGGDAHLAQDVAQRVFTDLARKAAALAGRPVLSGWLHRATHYAATDVVRAERRRRVREQKAHAMQELIRHPDAEPDWDRLRPVLDQVVDELGERDRDAVILRFIEGRGFADIGAVLRLSEDAARMRVDRALDKLRGLLAKRGVTSTSAALAVALTNQAGVAAPAGLAANVTSAALAGATATGIAALMGMTRLQMGIAGALGLAVIAGFVLQHQANAARRGEIQSLQVQNRQIERLEDENRRLARAVAEVAVLREDDAKLLRLRNEAAGLRQRLEQVAVVAPPVPRQVFVSGEVGRPARLSIPSGASMSLKDILAQAGGLTENSKGKDIRVLRRLPDGKEKVITVDVEKELQGEGVGPAFVLEPGDNVFVPPRLILPRKETEPTPIKGTGP
jgi:RNA polymerase sigma factor (sigma-70 family)